MKTVLHYSKSKLAFLLITFSLYACGQGEIKSELHDESQRDRVATKDSSFYITFTDISHRDTNWVHIDKFESELQPKEGYLVISGVKPAYFVKMFHQSGERLTSYLCAEYLD